MTIKPDDHDELIRLQTTCSLTRKQVAESLSRIEDILKDQKKYMENGITVKISDAVTAEVKNKMDECMKTFTEKKDNRNPGERSRKTDIKNLSKLQKTALWVAIVTAGMGVIRSVAQMAIDFLQAAINYFDKI